MKTPRFLTWFILPAFSLGILILVALLGVAAAYPARCDEIHNAARNGDLKKVQTMLLLEGDLVFSTDNQGATPLHWAAAMGRKDVALLLLANHAHVNAVDHSGDTPLHWATGGHFPRDAMEQLLGGTEVHKDLVEILITRGANVNAKDLRGDTPLVSLAAAFATNYQLSIRLNGNATGMATPVSVTYRADPASVDVAELLIEKGADVNAGSIPSEALFNAANFGNAGLVRLLIDKGADVHAKTKAGFTPLHTAATMGSEDVTALLLDRGADPNAQSQDGTTPLHSAAQHGHKAVVEILLLHWHPALTRKRYQTTIGLFLMSLIATTIFGFITFRRLWRGRASVAEKKRPVTTVGLLAGLLAFATLDALLGSSGYREGAALKTASITGVYAKNSDGETPLALAAQAGYADVAALLVSNQADVNSKDNDGVTPLQWALDGQHDDVAELLRRSGGHPKSVDSS